MNRGPSRFEPPSEPGGASCRDRRSVTILVLGTQHTQLTPVSSLSELPLSSLVSLPSPVPSLILRCLVALGMFFFGGRFRLRRTFGRKAIRNLTSVGGGFGNEGLGCRNRSLMISARFCLAMFSGMILLASASRLTAMIRVINDAIYSFWPVDLDPVIQTWRIVGDVVCSLEHAIH